MPVAIGRFAHHVQGFAIFVSTEEIGAFVFNSEVLYAEVFGDRGGSYYRGASDLKCLGLYSYCLNMVITG